MENTKIVSRKAVLCGFHYLYLTLFLSGAVVLIIEIAGARLLAPFFGSTIFVWSSLITVTLGFLALGYFAGGFFADKYPESRCFYFIIFLGAASALFLMKFSQPILAFSDKFGFRFGPLFSAVLLFALPIFLLSMAGPYVIRLRSKEPARAGHVSGIVFGVSTAGSLLGALLAGFYLIPNFFLSDIFAVSLAALMVAAVVGLIFSAEGGSASGGEKVPWRLIAVFILVLILFLLLLKLNFNIQKPNFSAAVIYHEPSFYGDIRVVENLGQRCLEVNSSSQTCVSIRTGASTLAYTRLIESLFAGRKQEGELLILGLGGGVLSRDLRNKFNVIDVVEIDPEMVFVAKEFFGYPSTDSTSSPQASSGQAASLNTYIADARNFVRNTNKKYDVIILDAFSGASPAPHLYTREAFEEIKNILKPGGIFLANTIGRSFGRGEVLPRSVFKTIGSVFPYRGAVSTENVLENPEALGNIVFAGLLEPGSFVVKKEFIVDFENISGEPPPLAGEPEILTDAKNPIEIYSAAIAGEVHGSYQNFLNKTIY